MQAWVEKRCADCHVASYIRVATYQNRVKVCALLGLMEEEKGGYVRDALIRRIEYEGDFKTVEAVVAFDAAADQDKLRKLGGFLRCARNWREWAASAEYGSPADKAAASEPTLSDLISLRERDPASYEQVRGAAYSQLWTGVSLALHACKTRMHGAYTLGQVVE